MALSSPPPVLLPSPSPATSQHIYTLDSETPLPSIEHDYPPSSSSSSSARNSSGRDSAIFDTAHPSSYADNSADDNPADVDTSPSDADDSDIISELPGSRIASYKLPTEEIPDADDEGEGGSVIFTPSQKPRSPFRNPSSVRAIQLSTTPPHLRSGGTPSRKYNHRPSNSNVSRGSTPRSLGARSPRNLRGGSGSPTKMNKAAAAAVRREHPLVLLHVTLLPVASSGYSQEIMEEVLPEKVLENWKLLREKVTETVLERGILIPHPREDYDVLEERLLESLELRVPRILKCGHFHLSPEEEEDVFADEDDDSEEDGEDGDVCEDCGRKIRSGIYGTGEGDRRWDIKVYASNGLMRAGAWAAAWREMERVDVEILPWIEDSMKREMDLRREEEMQRVPVSVVPEPEPTTPPSRNTMDEARRREIYGDNPPPVVDELPNTPKSAPRAPRVMRETRPEPPLADLLINYVRLLMQDRRNLVIAALSMLVLFFGLGVGNGSPQAAVMPAVAADIPQPVFATKASQLAEASTVLSASEPDTSVVPEIEVRKSDFQESSQFSVTVTVTEVQESLTPSPSAIPAETMSEEEQETKPSDVVSSEPEGDGIDEEVDFQNTEVGNENEDENEFEDEDEDSGDEMMDTINEDAVEVLED